ncbi:hypothetical protein ACP275_08G217000 [Erythranthe tilingii]
MDESNGSYFNTDFTANGRWDFFPGRSNSGGENGGLAAGLRGNEHGLKHGLVATVQRFSIDEVLKQDCVMRLRVCVMCERGERKRERWWHGGEGKKKTQCK